MGDWSLLDLYTKYRDVVNTWTINIRFHGGSNITVFTLKQYEQRDWLIAQMFLNIAIAILKRVGMYREGSSVADERAAWLKGQVAQCGLNLDVV